MKRSALLLALAAVLLSALQAEVKPAKLFTDQLVLQRDRPVPIWGIAGPGERVIVEFAGQRKVTDAASNGHWRINLDPLPASVEPRNLVIRGTNTLTYADVLVGEVWFCSGQSNMEKPLGPRRGQRPTTDHDLEIAAANFPLLRLFQVPRTDLKQDDPAAFRWVTCTSDSVAKSNFSAAAYYFGRQVQLTLGVPVGLIHSSFGGTRIEAWMPAEAFVDPQLAGLEKQKFEAWVPGTQPTELYQSMVRPYAPYAIRGFLWYQGETNCMAADVAGYARKQTALIQHWRRAWELPDAPFYGVLLAPFEYSKWEKFPTNEQALPRFWQEQVAAFSAPGLGYVVTTDLVDDLHDIHPVNKRDIGLRFARLALAETYGRNGIVSRGPTLASAQAASGKFIVSFDHAAGLRTRDGLGPTHFEIAGTDRIFRPADATLEGSTLILTSAEVPSPIAARFAWHEAATPNLINAAGLPAVPFRTDDWPVIVRK